MDSSENRARGAVRIADAFLAIATAVWVSDNLPFNRFMLEMGNAGRCILVGSVHPDFRQKLFGQMVAMQRRILIYLGKR